MRKVFALSMLLATLAFAAPTLQMPALLSAALKPSPAQHGAISGPDDEGNYHARVYQAARRAGSGRGGPTMYYVVCAQVSWDANGSMFPIDPDTDYIFNITSPPSRVPVPTSLCFAP